MQWEVFSAELKTWLLDRMGSTAETADADAQLLEATLRRMVDQILGEEAGSALTAADHAQASKARPLSMACCSGALRGHALDAARDGQR